MLLYSYDLLKVKRGVFALKLRQVSIFFWWEWKLALALCRVDRHTHWGKLPYFVQKIQNTIFEWKVCELLIWIFVLKIRCSIMYNQWYIWIIARKKNDFPKKSNFKPKIEIWSKNKLFSRQNSTFPWKSEHFFSY